MRQPSGALAGRVSSKFVGKAAENCRTPRSWCATLAFFVLLALAVRPAVAHTASLTRVDALLTTNSLTLTFQLNQPDLLQFLHARTNDAVIQMTEAEVRTLAPRIADYVQSRTRFALDTNAPARGTLSNWPPAPLTLTLEERPGEPRPAPLPLTFRWEIPPTAKQLELSLSLFDTVGFAALFEVLFHRGQGIPPVLQLVQSRQAMVIDLDAFQEDTRSTASTHAPPGPGGASPAPVRGNSAWQFVELGFTHILPKGLDHILFVLGLFLLSPKLKPLLWQVTAFTLAHSITLALAVLGIFALPGRVVEPLIALSIAVVAIENLFHTEVSPWRWVGVFGFGLIHGLGFAGVLNEVSLPRDQIGVALLSFNIGVELGQLAVIALALAATKWCEDRAWYGPWVRRPACLLIALAGVVWTVERLMA